MDYKVQIPLIFIDINVERSSTFVQDFFLCINKNEVPSGRNVHHALTGHIQYSNNFPLLSITLS